MGNLSKNFLKYIVLLIVAIFPEWGMAQTDYDNNKRPVNKGKTMEIDSLVMVAKDRFYSGKFGEAKEIGRQCAELEKSMFGSNHYRYANQLGFIANCYYNLGEYANAISFGEQALYILGRTLRNVHPDYATVLSGLCDYYVAQGDYAESIRMKTEALSIIEQTKGKDDLAYLQMLCSLAKLNSKLGNYQESIRLNTEVLEAGKRKNVKDSVYTKALSAMVNDYSAIGNYAEAQKVLEEVLRIQSQTIEKKDTKYFNALSKLAEIYANIGDYEKAIKIGKQVLNFREQEASQSVKKKLKYADMLASLASYNNLAANASGLENEYNYKKAIKYATEAREIYEKEGIKGSGCAKALNALSYTNYRLKKYQEAKEIGEEALRVSRRMGADHPDVAAALSNLATYNYYLGNYKEAIDSERKALNILEKRKGDKHPDYAKSLNKLAILHHYAQDVDSLTAFSIKSTRLCADIVRRTFADLTAYERNLFWHKFERWFSKIIPEFAYKYASDSLIVNAYNGVLLSKGLLLNSELEMGELLFTSEDEEIKSVYTELQQKRQTLNRLYDMPIAERQLNTDSLERVVNRLERRVVRRLKTYGDYTRHLAITYKDVQKKLNKEDVAVEFVSFPHGTDSTMYVAYVLRAGKSVPQMVPLFEVGQLFDIPSEQYYTTPAISKLVWGKLDQYMEGCSNVYFAPAGELYKIAVESLPDYNGGRQISDRYNFYRLSSTRELAVEKRKTKIEYAALYGGLWYDVANIVSKRGGVKYLPATKKEVEHIDNLLRRASVHSLLYTDSIGTEASFKDLSGRNMNVLHLATHGFYLGVAGSQAWLGADVSNQLQDGNMYVRPVEDNAMTQSGLCFSGVNNLNNLRMLKRLPENMEDGELTAMEISSLDLRGLDLAVLSACQTGLGEITGDGVFGLQRGFKKAGAKTIMMSLWSVPDSPTQMLMTRFYDNLLVNRNPKTRRPYTKFEALKDAQQYVREFEDSDDSGEVWKPYKSPENWAGFVLLDAIE